MSPSTRRLCEDLIRLGKSAIAIYERWLQEQPVEHDTRQKSSAA